MNPMTEKVFCYLLILMLIGPAVFGQTDTLNSLNSKGKKTGVWKVFLNEKADPVTKVKDAYFYGFELWDEGELVFAFVKHNWKKYKLAFDRQLPTKGNPIPLTGTFQWSDKNGRLWIEEAFENGNPLYIKTFSTSLFLPGNNTSLLEYIDFSRKYNNTQGTFYYEEHVQNSDKVESYWFRKGPKGWRLYRIEI